MFGSIKDPGSQSRIRDNIRFHSASGSRAVSDRIRQIEGAWDMEGATVAGLSGLGVFGLVAGLFGSRIARLFTWIALPLLFAFAIGRWSPPVGLLSRWGLRTRREIDEERNALKVLRGDYKDVPMPSAAETDGLGRTANRLAEAVRS